jgi:hypothetical protein
MLNKTSNEEAYKLICERITDGHKFDNYGLFEELGGSVGPVPLNQVYTIIGRLMSQNKLELTADRKWRFCG